MKTPRSRSVLLENKGAAVLYLVALFTFWLSGSAAAIVLFFTSPSTAAAVPLSLAVGANIVLAELSRRLAGGSIVERIRVHNKLVRSELVRQTAGRLGLNQALLFWLNRLLAIILVVSWILTGLAVAIREL